jgi:hypothetical protein
MQRARLIEDDNIGEGTADVQAEVTMGCRQGSLQGRQAL